MLRSKGTILVFISLVLLGGATPSIYAQEVFNEEAVNPVTIGPGGRVMREAPDEIAAEKGSSFHVHSLWESRYVSEGRDNLDGGSLLTAFTDLSWGAFTFAPWFGYGPGSDYAELNLSFIAGSNIGENFEVYGGYTHLRFPKDNEHDNEIGAGVVYTGLGFIDLGGDWYHSFLADGSFFEVVATRTVQVYDEVFASPFAMLGFNAGYVPDGHDGTNNLILGVDLRYLIQPRIEISGFASYNWEIGSDPRNRPGDELLKDFFWGGVGLRVNF
ncbi:MAG: hypothetical protein AAGD22_07205 [Verrucomicrobiota bacterium]